jgi:ribosome-binding protein aMBF1 (putative translation factor)
MAMPKLLQGRPVWAEALRRRREELGLTQEELAARTANELISVRSVVQVHHRPPSPGQQKPPVLEGPGVRL